MEEDKKIKENKRKLNDSIRRIIVVASIGLAVISSYTTAKGLSEYVFKDVFWQAMVVSIAIQGGLFVLNLNLLGYIKKSRLIIPLWIILLGMSCSFSYVYISEQVYPNELYREDANRILTEESIECCEILETYTTSYSASLLEDMEEFIFIIESEEKEESNNLSDKELESLKIVVEEINISEVTETDILEFIITINERLKFLNQKIFSSESDGVTKITMKEAIEELQDTKNVLESIKGKIQESQALEITKLNEERERLKNGGFDTSSQTYINLNIANQKREEKIDLMQLLLSKVEIKIQDMDNMISQFENESNYVINVTVQTIKEELIKSEPNLDTIQGCMDDLSVIVLQEKSEDIISSYRDFIKSVEVYKELLEKEENIKELYDELTKVLGSEEITGENLRTKWSDLLKRIRILFIELPKSQELMMDKENDATIEDNLWFEDKREEKLEFLSEIERRYFSDMNNLERAWILLTNHKYNTMAIYSFIFAVLLDAIGALMGIFLYVLENKDSQKKHTWFLSRGIQNKL